MKKIILSISVVLVFLGYTVYQNTGSPGLFFVGSNNYGTAPSNTNIQANNSPSGTDKKILVSKSVIQKTDTVVQKTTSTKSAVQSSNAAPVVVSNSGLYRDGQYIGSVADAFYGNLQVKAIISGGQLTDVQFLDYPQDRNNSIRINTQAMPMLKAEAIQAQSANVDIISGATATSEAFQQTLGSALAQAAK
jgi:uncharacterized protein with FMN-binding domain